MSPQTDPVDKTFKLNVGYGYTIFQDQKVSLNLN